MRTAWIIAATVLAAACGKEESRCERPGIDCDVELEPPERGFQTAVGPLEVADGTEVLRCFWRKVPEDTDVNRIVVKYNLGSHHLDIFTVPYSMADGDFDCSKPEEWGSWPSEVARGLDPSAPWPRIMIGFQNDTIDWSLPQRVGFTLPAGTQLLIQSHFANVASQAVPTDRLYNLINFAASDVASEVQAETLFDEDFDIRIPAKTQASVTRICDFPQEVNIIGMFGHFHSRGVRHRVFTYDPDTQTTGAQIYENTDWDEPPWYTVEQWGGAAVTARSIKMIAEYDNFEDREIVWGNFVQENEHFETYTMFYPRLDLDQSCVCHREGEPPPGVAAGNCN